MIGRLLGFYCESIWRTVEYNWKTNGKLLENIVSLFEKIGHYWKSTMKWSGRYWETTVSKWKTIERLLGGGSWEISFQASETLIGMHLLHVHYMATIISDLEIQIKEPFFLWKNHSWLIERWANLKFCSSYLRLRNMRFLLSSSKRLAWPLEAKVRLDWEREWSF